MRLSARVYYYEPLTRRERRALRKIIFALLPDGFNPRSRARLMNHLSRAVSRAKPSVDLTPSTYRDRALNEYVDTCITGVRSPGDEPPSPLEALREATRVNSKGELAIGKRVRHFPLGRGRPSDAWKYTLLFDVRRALRCARVPGNSFKTDADTRLTDIYRACAAAAGEQQVGDVRGVWNHAKRLVIEHVPDAPKPPIPPQ